MEYLPPNKTRGTFSLVSIALIGIGAGMLWGWGAAFLAIGCLFWVDLVVDELVERLTKVTKWPTEG